MGNFLSSNDFLSSFEEYEKISKQLTTAFEKELTNILGDLVCYDGRIKGPWAMIPYLDFVSFKPLTEEEKEEIVKKIYSVAAEYGLMGDINAAIEKAQFDNDIKLQLMTKAVQCDALEVRTTKTSQHEALLGKEYCDIAINKALFEELIITFVRNVVETMRKLGTQHAETNKIESQVANVNNYSDILNATLHKAAHIINEDSHTGLGKFIVCGARQAVFMQDTATFIPEPPKYNDTFNGLIFKAGIWNGFEVYVDPNMSWDDMSITMGKKCGGSEKGLHWGLYQGEYNKIANVTLDNNYSLRLRGYVTPLGKGENDFITFTINYDESVQKVYEPVVHRTDVPEYKPKTIEELQPWRDEVDTTFNETKPLVESDIFVTDTTTSLEMFESVANKEAERADININEYLL